MRYSVCLCAVWLLGFCAAVCPAYAGDGDHLLPVAGTQWKGRKVAFMGDSITDKAHVGTTKNYWQYLQEMLGLVPFVYGINGQQWRDVPGQCEKLRAERGGFVCGGKAVCGSVFSGKWDAGDILSRVFQGRSGLCFAVGRCRCGYDSAAGTNGAGD